MTKKLTLLLTLLIMVSVVFSASDDSAKNSPAIGRRVPAAGVNLLRSDKVLGDPDEDPRRRKTVGQLMGELQLRQAFPPAKFSVYQQKGGWIIIVKSDERFRIDRSSPLYEVVEKQAREDELEKVAQYARDNPGSPPQTPRAVTLEDRHAIICALFGISINMTNEQILNRIAKVTKKDPREVQYEALGMVLKGRPGDPLQPVEDQ